VHTNAGIEAQVRAAFGDAPLMVNVARCESRFRQYADSGAVFYGGYNNGMVGIYQLYESIHRKAAAALGFDISTIEGNIGYARHLYDTQGTDPWLDSFKCWNPNVVEAVATTTLAASPTTAGTTSALLTIDMSLGKIDPQVLTLQKILNASGFAVAASGPGAPGQETTKYGSLTRDAVRKFQCAKNIACSGSEGTTGYGFVGARTRSAIMIAYAGNPSSGLAVAVPAVAPTPSAPSTVAPTGPNAALIAQLQLQVTQLTNIIAALLAERANASSQTASAATAMAR
jgi:peptidoglycan hydrolase-like protein with peptidoglycan-binding domain